MKDRELNKVLLLKDDKIVEEVISNLDSVCIIKNLLEKHSIELKSISTFECEPGPEGSFTGLKIAAAIANTLNWSQNNDAKAAIPMYQASKYDK